MTQRDKYAYNPETGDLRSIKSGEPIGNESHGNRLYAYFEGRHTTVAAIAYWVETGTYNRNVIPIDGNWFNLKFSNLAIKEPDTRALPKSDDRLRFRNDGFYLGPYRLSPMHEKIVLRLSMSKQTTHDDMIRTLWPDPDDQPLTTYNTISVYLCRLNKMMRLHKAERFTECGLTSYRITPITA
jgi:hypothetical protein